MRKFYSFLLATVALLCSTAANAQSFTIDNLNYAILSSADKTVALTGGSPSGELVIPSTVTYESVDYTVTEVAANAKETIAEGEYFFRQNGPHGKETMYDNEGGAFSVSNVDCTVVGNEYVWTLSAGTNGGYYILNKNSNLYLTSDISTVSARSLALKATPEEFYFYKYTYDNGEKACYLIQSEAMAANNEALDAAGNNDEVIAWPIGTDNETSNWELVPNFGWSYNSETKTLTISADAAMMDYVNIESRPWHHVSSSIENIIIGEDVTTIGNNAFSGCTGLENITLLMPAENLTGIGDNAFSGVSSSCALNVPNGEASDYAAIDEFSSFTNVTELDFYGKCGDNAFWTLDEGALTIFGTGEMYNYADNDANRAPWYADRENITSVTIEEGVTSIGNSAFDGCTGLTSIEIPKSVTSIGNYAFYYCPSLTSIEIPSSVTSIGHGAFYRCTGLTSIVSHIAAEDLFAPGDYAFNGIDKDACTIYVPAGAKSTYTATEQWKDFTNIVEPNGKCGDNAYWALNEETGALTIFGTGAMYDYAAFDDANRAPWYADRENITSVTIEEGVTTIGHDAFRDCYGLTSIEIPSSVTSIGYNAFCDCTGLTSVEISEGVTSIGDWAFANCGGLTSIEIPSSVTSIGEWAFWSCSGLTSIEIPSSVTSIGNTAFDGCNGLTSIVVDEGNTIYDSRGNCNAIIETASNTLIRGCKNTVIPSSITSIGYNAFISCTGLTSIEIPSSVTSIGDGAFADCPDLTSIEIPSSVTSIGQDAFYWCTGLTSIEIPSSVTSIGYNAFIHCTGLTSVEIPSSVTSIENGTFSGCSGLTSVVIPSSVTNIGDWAFSGCTGLTSVEIPSSVTSIGECAFWECTGLTSITSHIAAEDLFAPGENAFYGVDKDACTLYVPAGAKSTYAATEQWKDFTNIVEAYDLTVTAAGYATLYLGTAVEIPAGVEAYTAGRIEGDRLKMQAVEDVIPANTAVIIKAEEGKYTFIPSKETPDAIEGNLLRGTLTDTYIKPGSAQTAYVLSKVDGIVGMYRAKLKADGTFKNNANRVYMLLGELNVGEGDLDTSNPGGQLSNGYRFDFSGTTAIEGVENEQQGEAVYYDLSGRRVENPTKGIYIVNGKKVLVK